jgi:hypothetical protein
MDQYIQRQLQDAIVRAFENIKREMELYSGVPCIDKLRRVVEFKRGKRLVHDQLPLRGELTAFCVALSDVDLIRTCIDADEPLRETSYIHECIHFLSNDLPTVSIDMTYPEFLTLSKDELAILHRKYIACYRSSGTNDSSDEWCRASAFNNPREFISEKVAALLYDYFEQCKSSVPQNVITIYGYRS